MGVAQLRLGDTQNACGPCADDLQGLGVRDTHRQTIGQSLGAGRLDRPALLDALRITIGFGRDDANDLRAKAEQIARPDQPANASPMGT